MSNGSRWAGEEAGDIDELLDVLGTHKLDRERFDNGFYTVDPCEGVYNPDFKYNSDLPQWVDGPRMYSCDGVVRFFGNFENLSHVFNIDTNHQPTINALMKAIENNSLVQETYSL
jgi:hypothetical protein